MTRLGGIIIGSFLLCSAAFADRVLTREGRTLHGRVSFGDQGGVRVITPDTTHNIAAADLARIILDNSRSKPGLSDVSFRLYQGNWKQLPDFDKLTVDKSGRMSSYHLDLSPLGMDGARRVFRLEHGQTLDRWNAPMVDGRPFSISATVEACGDGVILAQGGNMDGLALYLQEGHLHFVTCINRELTIARDELPFPLNRPVKVAAKLRRDLELVLTVDGREAASLESPGLILHRPLEGLSVGFDQRPSLVGPYRNDHHFQGTLKEVEVRLMGMGLVYAGKLNIAKSGEYEFGLSSGSSTRLEINGQRVIDNPGPSKPGQSRGAIKLTAGTHELRLTYAQLTTPKVVSAENHLALHWSGPGFPRQTLTTTPHPQAQTWQPADGAIPSAGIMTSNGSFIAVPARSVDVSKVHFENISLARKDVSILFLRQLSITESTKLADKPPGALLMDGTYTEGKLLSLDDKIAAISSILFGIKRLKRGHEAAAIILKPASQPTTQKSVRLHDGSLFFSENYSVKDGQIILDNPLFKDRPIPLAEVAEISHVPAPSHFQFAQTRWEAHSVLGQHFLGKRARQTMKVVRQYREAQSRLMAAKKSMVEGLRALPALAEAEEQARPAYEEAKAKYDALREAVKLHKKTHKPLDQAHLNANRQLEANCEKSARASEVVQNFIFSRQWPLREKVDQIREEIREKGESPDTKARLAGAKKQLADAESQMVNPKATLSQTIEDVLKSDQAELEAQLLETEAWRVLFRAQQAMGKIEVEYQVIKVDYEGKQSAANAIRQKMARAKRDGDLATGKIGILEPILQEIFEP